jgi:type IV pilus assembly protein PilB
MGFEQPDKSQVDVQAFELLPADYVRKHLVMPLRFDGKVLVVGMADPPNVFLIDEVSRRTKREVQRRRHPRDDINRLVEQLQPARPT